MVFKVILSLRRFVRACEDSFTRDISISNLHCLQQNQLQPIDAMCRLAVVKHLCALKPVWMYLRWSLDSRQFCPLIKESWGVIWRAAKLVSDKSGNKILRDQRCCADFISKKLLSAVALFTRGLCIFDLADNSTRCPSWCNARDLLHVRQLCKALHYCATVHVPVCRVDMFLGHTRVYQPDEFRRWNFRVPSLNGLSYLGSQSNTTNNPRWWQWT